MTKFRRSASLVLPRAVAAGGVIALLAVLHVHGWGWYVGLPLLALGGEVEAEGRLS